MIYVQIFLSVQDNNSLRLTGNDSINYIHWSTKLGLVEWSYFELSIYLLNTHNALAEICDTRFCCGRSFVANC